MHGSGGRGTEYDPDVHPQIKHLPFKRKCVIPDSMSPSITLYSCRTPFGSYPMSVVFVLSYWKLPEGLSFLVRVFFANCSSAEQLGIGL